MVKLPPPFSFSLSLLTSLSYLPYPKYPLLYFCCALSPLCPRFVLLGLTFSISLFSCHSLRKHTQSLEGHSYTVTHIRAWCSPGKAPRQYIGVQWVSGLDLSAGHMFSAQHSAKADTYCAYTHANILYMNWANLMSLLFQLCMSFPQTCSQTKREQKELWPCMSCV